MLDRITTRSSPTLIPSMLKVKLSVHCGPLEPYHGEKSEARVLSECSVFKNAVKFPVIRRKDQNLKNIFCLLTVYVCMILSGISYLQSLILPK